MASLIGGVENLIVEDREVESETKTDGMRRCKIGGRNLSGSLVCLQRLVRRRLAFIANCEFSEVAVIVSLPVSNLAFKTTGKLAPEHTSCGRTPWTRHSEQKESSGSPGLPECPHRSSQAPLQSFDDTP